MSLEVLDFALMLLCLLHGVEGAQVAAPAGGRILLAGVETELAGCEFSYHGKHVGCGAS